MIELELPFDPPFAWDTMLAFYRARAITGAENVEGSRYLRTFALGGARGSVAITAAGKRALRATLLIDDRSALAGVERRLRAMLDLDAPMREIDRRLAAIPELEARVAGEAGVRVPGTWDAYEAALRAVLGQQISVAAAITLASRITAQLGEPLARELTFADGPTRLLPDAARFADAELSGLGLTRMRVRTLHELARAVLARPELLDGPQPIDEFERRFTELPGIGPWTAHYVAMRGRYERDAFPAADLGLLKAMESAGGRPSARELLARVEPLRPYRAYAVIRLWLQPNPLKNAS